MTTLQKKQKLIEEAEKLSDADFIDYLIGIIEGETSWSLSYVFGIPAKIRTNKNQSFKQTAFYQQTIHPGA